MAIAMTELLTERMVRETLNPLELTLFLTHKHTLIDTQVIGSQIFCLDTSKLWSSHQTERAAKTDNLEMNKLSFVNVLEDFKLFLVAMAMTELLKARVVKFWDPKLSDAVSRPPHEPVCPYSTYNWLHNDCSSNFLSDSSRVQTTIMSLI